MKKSEIYTLAMKAVLAYRMMDDNKRLEVLSVLIGDKNVAELVEKAEQEKEDSEE